MGFVLLLGGARSGKSRLADLLGRESSSAVTFIATATAGDEEMAERIRQHQEARLPDWTTVDAPLALAGAISKVPADSFVIVDCLTLWVSNLLGSGQSAEQICALAEEAARGLAQRRGVAVSNEVGMGIVPGNELARTFRDVLGAVNATFADHAERSLLMVAGRALELSPAAAIIERG
jgi:adenosyl cobinamide kinase/adenosyl cobinamide phosphate guanylyltransferase